MRPGENRFADFEDQQGRNIGRSDAFAGDFRKPTPDPDTVFFPAISG